MAKRSVAGSSQWVIGESPGMESLPGLLSASGGSGISGCCWIGVDRVMRAEARNRARRGMGFIVCRMREVE